MARSIDSGAGAGAGESPAADSSEAPGDYTDAQILQAIGKELKTLNASVNTIRQILVFFFLLWLLGAVLFIVASASASD